MKQFGGNSMIRVSKKLIAFMASASMFVGSLGVLNANANDIVYTQDNVSISSALERYIAANDDVYLVEKESGTTLTDAVAEEVLSTKVDEKAEVFATGSVSEVAKVGDDTTESNDDTESAESSENNNTTETTETADNNENTSSAEDTAVAPAEDDFVGKAVVKAGGFVNIRSSADINSNIVGTISNGGIMTVVEKGSEWSHITSGSCDGYIRNDLLAFDGDALAYAKANLEKVAVVEASALKLRAGEGEDTECLTLLSQGERYSIENVGTAWTRIVVDATLSGYVKNDYISISYGYMTAVPVQNNSNDNQTSDSNQSTETPEETPAETPSETPSEAPADVPASPLGVDVANYALQFVGNPYVYGGTSLTNGADCSGFVMKVYEHFGYSIPRTADVQGTVGTEVSISALAPGDLVFYDHGTGSIKHVGLYIGNGQIVHASNSTTGIIVSNMNYSTPCKAVRIIN